MDLHSVYIVGARSLDEEDLCKPRSLQVFRVPQAGIDTTRSKMDMKLYDKYANVKGMYSARSNGGVGPIDRLKHAHARHVWYRVGRVGEIFMRLRH